MPDPRRPNRAPAASRAATLPTWGAACFFASGAAGLLYEVVWSKELAYLLGNSLQAVATVVAAFLGGLAIGARWLGTPLARRGRGPRTYALLELGVLALGIVSVPGLRALDPLVGALYRSLGEEGAAFATARFGLLAALLLPPAALMGATLPVLVGHFERDRVGPALARLYGLNTFGAVAGSMLGGFALLPGIGLFATTGVAAALNAAVAFVAWRAPAEAVRAARPEAAAERRAPAGQPRPNAAPPAAVPARPREVAAGLAGGRRAAFALLFALSGFAALVLQITWVRLFSLVFGSSVYSFSAVLGIYLTGLALGSVLVGPLMRRGVSLAGFGRLQIALALSAALMLHAFSRLPEWMFALMTAPGGGWDAVFRGELALCAALLIVPCALLGAAFPVATRLLQVGESGHAAGFAYAVNTLGTIAGSLAAGFWMVPAWGVQGSQIAALAIAAAVGLGTLLLVPARSRRPRDLLGSVGGAAFAAVLVVGAPRWDPMRMSFGLFRPTQAASVGLAARFTPGAGAVVERATRTQHVLYYREGINASVLVGFDGQSEAHWLRVGGKVDASTDDMQTQALLGLVPAACADSGARALVIGLGSGITTAAVLAGGAGPTEVVELEPGVVEGSRFFHAAGENPLDDPRVRLVLGDARTHLAHGSGRYGLIVSEPSNPWIAGVNNLFTVDFYRRVRARLDERGVFCQWMQLYELSPETFRSMLASFFEVFPRGQVFAVWHTLDILLVAMPGDRVLALDRLRGPAARRLLDRAHIDSPEAVAAYWVGPFASLAPAAHGVATNRDDRPIVEYRAPRDLIESAAKSASRWPAASVLVPLTAERPAGPLFAGWTPETWYDSRVRGLLADHQEDRARTVVRGAAAAGFTALTQRLELEISAAERLDSAIEQRERAKVLFARGRIREGHAALERAVAIDPGEWNAWAIIADQRRIEGDLAGSRVALGRVRAAGTSEALGEAALLEARLEVSRRRMAAAMDLFHEAERQEPRRSAIYIFEAEALRDSGDLGAARATIERGLGMIPGQPALTEMLARMGSSR